MPFDAEIIVTGLVLIVLDSTQSGNPAQPDSVELLALKDFTNSHTALLNFGLEDVINSAPKRFKIQMTPAGTAMVSKEIANDELKVVAEGSEEPAHYEIVTSTNSASPILDALDWIPDLQQDFAIPNVHLRHPAGIRNDPKFISRMLLPKGRITSRSLFVDPPNFPNIAEWDFKKHGQTVRRKIMADQMVWSRKGLEKLEIHFDNGQFLVLDGESRQRRGDSTPVRLSFTNMPLTSLSSRYGMPNHFNHYRGLDVNAPANFIAGCCAGAMGSLNVDRVQNVPGFVTEQGGCPPVKVGNPPPAG